MKNNQLMLSNNNRAFLNLIEDSSKKINDVNEVLTGLKSITTTSNATLSTMIAEQENQLRYQRGYNLGVLKAFIDTLPTELAEAQTFNGVPLNMLIKLKVDEDVLKQIDRKNCSVYMSFNSSHWANYRRLSEMICGYGYSMVFSQSRFEEYFKNGVHMFVAGFANGYSHSFHMISAEAGIVTEKTHPVHQDIWKNWQFFLEPDMSTYHLDGEFLFMYHGGFNCSDDFSIPYGNNVRVINVGIYDSLKSRPISSFESKDVSDIFNF